MLCQSPPTNHRPLIWALVFSVCASVTTAFASSPQTQATGADLIGIVTDVSEAVLPAVTVRAINQETGLVRTVETAADGRFAVRGLPVGTYRAEAEAPGFDRLIVPDVSLTLGSSVSVTLTLAVAGVAYDLDVVAQRSLRDPQQPGIGRVVERAELERLPVTVRNYLAFSLPTPAAAPDRTPQQGASRTSGLSFAGQRARCGHLP